MADNINARDELLAIQDLTIAAYKALDDEAEAAFRDAVVELHSRAGVLLHLVETW